MGAHGLNNTPPMVIELKLARLLFIDEAGSKRINQEFKKSQDIFIKLLESQDAQKKERGYMYKCIYTYSTCYNFLFYFIDLTFPTDFGARFTA